MIGKTIGHYRVVTMLGEGGMGEVYRAEDTRLDRDVAIKVLPPAFSKDAERLARFDREARLLAALDHPNIAGIYGLEQDDDGRQLLVMQLAEGETLAARIARGSITPVDALPIALQIAAALEAAHEKGIVHRDLKPGNVMVTEDGQVKVLDFGLAKALEPASGSDLESLRSESRTLAEQETEPGVVLGTAGYMSPEQARGKPVDKRTDIWSFGCLLFEMLTGKRAFEGETGSDTLAAILEREPPLDSLSNDVSPGIRDLLRRCLRKDARERLRDIGDARIELAEEISGERSSSVVHEAPAPTPKTSNRAPLLAVIALLAVAAVTTVWLMRPKRPVVYLIDTVAALGIYDPETLRSGGTNADDLTDALADLPISLVKENSSPGWHREHQVLSQQPDLIVIHLSAFAHQPGFDSFDVLGQARAELEGLGLEDPMELGWSKLIAFFGYVALGSPDTKFIVYSRGRFKDDDVRDTWISAAVTRFPELGGKIFTYDVPGAVGTATFRDPATAEGIESFVASILGFD